MLKFAWLINTVCILGMAFLVWSVDGVVTGPVSTVTPLPAPEVVKPKVILADGKWSDFVGSVAEKCAIQAMIAAPTMPEADALFNQCVFDQGLTI